MKHRLQHAPEPLTDVDDGLIVALWKQGLDTYAIAKQLHVFEWQVANRLFHIREANRGS
ncbi:hypothetical protein [Bradyrhizobium sp. CCH5-F6]|uniref:hypothetical protein n=1 Tax=Bradyrhizobium sp. CCH5-F6 TaxID=1768753 RepID=UPI000A6CDE30|nr:hypothetical protein [Bradyrhizobium sp. CCH5-F6]